MDKGHMSRFYIFKNIVYLSDNHIKTGILRHALCFFLTLQAGGRSGVNQIFGANHITLLQ